MSKSGQSFVYFLGAQCNVKGVTKQTKPSPKIKTQGWKIAFYLLSDMQFSKLGSGSTQHDDTGLAGSLNGEGLPLLVQYGVFGVFRGPANPNDEALPA